MRHDTCRLFGPWSDSPHQLGHILPGGHAHLKVQKPGQPKKSAWYLSPVWTVVTLSSPAFCHILPQWPCSSQSKETRPTRKVNMRRDACTAHLACGYAHLKVWQPVQQGKSVWDMILAIHIFSRHSIGLVIFYPVAELVSKYGNLSIHKSHELWYIQLIWPLAMLSWRWWWPFPRMREFWENVWQFIPCLPFFFFFEWRLARAH